MKSCHSAYISEQTRVSRFCHGYQHALLSLAYTLNLIARSRKQEVLKDLVTPAVLQVFPVRSVRLASRNYNAIIPHSN
jgi:hypothetical protein